MRMVPPSHRPYAVQIQTKAVILLVQISAAATNPSDVIKMIWALSNRADTLQVFLAAATPDINSRPMAFTSTWCLIRSTYHLLKKQTAEAHSHWLLHRTERWVVELVSFGIGPSDKNHQFYLVKIYTTFLCLPRTCLYSCTKNDIHFIHIHRTASCPIDGTVKN